MYELAALPDVLPELPVLDEPFEAGGQVHLQCFPVPTIGVASCYRPHAPFTCTPPPPPRCPTKAGQLAVISAALTHVSVSSGTSYMRRRPAKHHAGSQRSPLSQVAFPGSSALLGMPPIGCPMAASLGAAPKGSHPRVSAFGSGGGAAQTAAKSDPFAAGFGSTKGSSPVCPLTGQRPGGLAPPQLPPPQHFPPALQALAEQQRRFMERKYQEQVCGKPYSSTRDLRCTAALHPSQQQARDELLMRY